MLVADLDGSTRIRIASVCRLARSHTTRLETRTKESIHMCEYASAKLVGVVKATAGT